MSTAGAGSSGHVLVVDDDREIRDLLGRFLAKHGYRVTAAQDGKEMRRALTDWHIDLVVLDLMLPGEDGLSLCRDLRAKSRVPVIMLTMMGEETDRIIGLEMGADDYLPKPFNPRELLARMKAVLRRAHCAPAAPATGRGKILRFAGWKLDLGLRRLESPQGLIVDLSAGEFDLLVAFAERPERVLNRDQLLDLTHGRAEAPFDRSIDMQVSRLRRKIEVNAKEPELIKTVRGGGYIFTAVVTQDEPVDT
jgi:two-component system OmpR family response regulator